MIDRTRETNRLGSISRFLFRWKEEQQELPWSCFRLSSPPPLSAHAGRQRRPFYRALFFFLFVNSAENCRERIG